ncbi:UvrD-helicase domain-containing protein [Pseudomonas syringae]|uniref:UvrD-helicase domain-containing protein n=1 Tax=Pseudomonas syringae TaxID=317 RepID=UPI00035217FF|nr:UvrD-helicase domain-containing protein [Pseudomonas syringae]EPF64256.1 Putative superfamily I DNA/RNA helicase [Pseudomonas syringae pv. syringae SM]
MNTTWWKTLTQLSPAQQEFIALPPQGRHLLEGPPGSGKTNLLLLRAEYMAGSAGFRNTLIVTYTKSLSQFIKSGIAGKDFISPSQVKTYHSWAFDHVYQYLNIRPDFPDLNFNDASRSKLLKLVLAANKKLPSPILFDAIFVDEAQDLTFEELESLLCLSKNVCICGDIRQGIYNQNGLENADDLKLQRHTLTEHFRIGHKVARIADRLLPPKDGAESLENTSNYNISLQGESSANMNSLDNRDLQFEAMIKKIRVELVAFKNDSIGIFCATKETRREMQDRFKKTDLNDLLCTHGVGGLVDFAAFPIHLMTIHSSKGTEFRGVHIFGAEELKDGALKRTKLSYTAVTRAKTALNIYKSGETTRALESAFSAPAPFNLNDLFKESK